MVKEFKSFYDKLPENLQTIITETIIRMEKTHKKNPHAKFLTLNI